LRALGLCYRICFWSFSSVIIHQMGYLVLSVLIYFMLYWIEYLCSSSVTSSSAELFPELLGGHTELLVLRLLGFILQVRNSWNVTWTLALVEKSNRPRGLSSSPSRSKIFSPPHRLDRLWSPSASYPINGFYTLYIK
jgi:hypothetical protein